MFTEVIFYVYYHHFNVKKALQIAKNEMAQKVPLRSLPNTARGLRDALSSPESPGQSPGGGPEGNPRRSFRNPSFHSI